MNILNKLPKEVLTWDLANIKNQQTTNKIPNELSNIATKNALIINNGEVVSNNSQLKEESFEIKVMNNNEFSKYDKTITFVVSGEVKETIDIVNYASNNTSLQVVIKVGKFSNVKINEIVLGNAKSVNANVVIVAEAESKLKYQYITTLESEKTYQKIDVLSYKDSNVEITTGYLNTNDSLVHVNGNALESGAVITSTLIAITNKEENQRAVVNLVNNAKNSETYINNYVVANGKSKFIMDGIGKIEKSMSQSKAFQSTKGLILTEDAECHTNPFLLIDEYDVEAGHGATVGRIDDDHLYYLMSRGLSKHDASSLIVKGYTNYLFEKIDNEKMLEISSKAVSNKLK